MWTPELPSEVPAQRTQLSARRTLYYFDGPQIFAGRFGFLDALFVKVDELGEGNLFLASPSNEHIIDLIATSQLSVRAGFMNAMTWLVKTDDDLNVERYWICSAGDVPEELLPDAGASLSERHEVVPDTLDQLNSFFSLNFKGDDLKSAGMSFATFKRLVDDSYDAARRILSPLVLVGSRSATFDFRIKEPTFSSLVLSIDAPLVNLRLIRRRAGDKELDVHQVRNQFVTQRTAFFNQMEEAIRDATAGRSKSFDQEERFFLLDQIQHVIPSEENRIKSVLFFSHGDDGKTLSAFVDEKIGLVLHRALRDAERKPIQDSGRVKIINSTSRSFVFTSRRGKEVTCYVRDDWFQELSADPRFRNRCLVSVRGVLNRRARRDVMNADEKPTLMDGPFELELGL